MNADFPIPQVGQLKVSAPKINRLEGAEMRLNPPSINTPSIDSPKASIPDSQPVKADFPQQSPSNKEINISRQSSAPKENSPIMKFTSPRMKIPQSERQVSIQTSEKKLSNQSGSLNEQKSSPAKLQIPDFEGSSSANAGSPSLGLQIPDFDNGSASSTSGSGSFNLPDPNSGLIGSIKELISSLSSSEESSGGYQQPFYSQAFHHEHEHSPFFGRER